MTKISEKYDQVMFNLPLGTKARIRNLAAPYETMTSVILRAIALLEQSKDTLSIEHQDISRSILRDELDEIKARLTALENAAKASLRTTRRSKAITTSGDNDDGNVQPKLCDGADLND